MFRESRAVMIRCVKDISPEADRELRALPPGPGYRFLGRHFEVRSNSIRLSRLVDDIYEAFRSPVGLSDPVVTYLLEDGGDRETPPRANSRTAGRLLLSRRFFGHRHLRPSAGGRPAVDYR